MFKRIYESLIKQFVKISDALASACIAEGIFVIPDPWPLVKDFLANECMNVKAFDNI